MDFLLLGPLDAALSIKERLEQKGHRAIHESALSRSRLMGIAESEGDLVQVIEQFCEAVSRPGTELGDQSDLWVHPCASQFAESNLLFSLAEKYRLKVVGVSVEIASLFSNRWRLLRHAQTAGAKNLLLSDLLFTSVEQLKSEAKKCDWPATLVLRSARRGGGAGAFVCESLDSAELCTWFEQVSLNTGATEIFVEKFADCLKLFTFPFARFRSGRIEFFSEIDVSVQSRFRKTLEFCPPFQLEQALRIEMRRQAAQVLGELNYVGVGALEFGTDFREVFWLDGSCRLGQTVKLWETVSQISVLDWQIATSHEQSEAEIIRLSRPKPRLFGCAARVYAEDSLTQIPQPGWIVEVESHTKTRYLEGHGEFRLAFPGTPAFTPKDGLLGVAFAFADQKGLLGEYLQKTLESVFIAGQLKTNESLISQLASHQWVMNGRSHAGFLDEEFVPDPNQWTEELSRVAAQLVFQVAEDPGILRLAVGDFKFERKNEMSHSRLKAARFSEVNRWSDLEWVSGEFVGEKVSARSKFFVANLGQTRWMVRIGNEFSVVRDLDQEKGEVVHSLTGSKVYPYLFTQSAGVVHQLGVKEGDLVAAHQALAWIDSCRLLVPHALPVRVRLVRWLVSEKQWVEQGKKLATVEIVR